MSIRSSIEDIVIGRRHREIASRGIDLAAEQHSKEWFMDTARRLRTINPYQLFFDKDLRKRGGIEIGKMYLYQYDAIYKKELDYWDTLPLMFPTDLMDGPSGKGMLGINFHYLPRGARAYLLDALYPNATDDKLSPSARMSYGYHALKAMASFDIIKPCIHRYVFTKVQGPYVEIPPDDWAIALMLPLERFVSTKESGRNLKVNMTHVGRNSLSGIKKRW